MAHTIYSGLMCAMNNNNTHISSLTNVWDKADILHLQNVCDAWCIIDDTIELYMFVIGFLSHTLFNPNSC